MNRTAEDRDELPINFLFHDALLRSSSKPEVGLGAFLQVESVSATACGCAHDASFTQRNEDGGFRSNENSWRCMRSWRRKV